MVPEGEMAGPAHEQCKAGTAAEAIGEEWKEQQERSDGQQARQESCRCRRRWRGRDDGGRVAPNRVGWDDDDDGHGGMLRQALFIVIFSTLSSSESRHPLRASPLDSPSDLET